MSQASRYLDEVSLGNVMDQLVSGAQDAPTFDGLREAVEEQFARAVAAKLNIGFDRLRFGVDDVAMRFLPPGDSKRCRAVCFNANRTHAFVAFADPFDSESLAHATSVVRKVGREVRRFVSTTVAIDYWIHNMTNFIPVDRLFDQVDALLDPPAGSTALSLNRQQPPTRLASLLVGRTVVTQILDHIMTSVVRAGSATLAIAPTRAPAWNYEAIGHTPRREVFMTLRQPLALAIIETIVRSQEIPATPTGQPPLWRVAVDGDWLTYRVRVVTVGQPELTLELIP